MTHMAPRWFARKNPINAVDANCPRTLSHPAQQVHTDIHGSELQQMTMIPTFSRLITEIGKQRHPDKKSMQDQEPSIGSGKVVSS